MKELFTCSWSGGKDAALALIRLLLSGYRPAVLINMLNEEGDHSRAHGLPVSIIQAQADALNIPLLTAAAGWEDYAVRFADLLQKARLQYQAKYMAFGDIDLQEHRDWEEAICANNGLIPLWPLWQVPRSTVADMILENNVKAIIISVKDTLDQQWLGQEYNLQTIHALKAEGIDCCGEDGSFHTFVYDTPFFSRPVAFQKGNTVHANGHYILEVSRL